MKQHNTDSRKQAIATAPLFASVWLALFHSLRERYAARDEDLSNNVNCPAAKLD